MRSVVINEILIPSLKKLYEMDYNNIKWGVSERNICARLAHQMENIMRQYDAVHDSNRFARYYADVEYNRMGNGDLKHFENSEHVKRYMVSDLLIQNRGPERNLLAVEMKREGNKRGVEDDKDRLKSLVSMLPENEDTKCVHDTLVGAFIIYSPQDVKVEIYEAVNGEGKKTDELLFKYTPERTDVLTLIAHQRTN